MKCPECKVPLTPKSLAGLELDVCEGCTGIWFDAGELTRYRESKSFGALRLGSEQAKFTPCGSPKICPKCDTSTMSSGTLGTVRNAAHCTTCHGFFAFDVNRLAVRQLFELLASFITCG